ncbi:MAG: serine hydroxymethyltransferase, partial [Francisellaceae bacterium]|nr:serine hydroxymethyltransferase [Francisellaceae bacterium]
NKNAVPNDPKSPFVTSGLRVGTPAITTRGFKESESSLLAGWMADILEDTNNEEIQAKVKDAVLALCSNFPVYKSNAI